MERSYIFTDCRLVVTGLIMAVAVMLPSSALPQNQPSIDRDFDSGIFKSPPARYRGHAMWNFNLTTLNEKSVTSGIQEMAKLNYGGFFIEAGGRPQPGQGVAFLSDEYFRYYKLAIEEAKRQGLEMVLYDDYAFPTGTVGGQMLAKYPQYVAHSLNMAEKDVTGPAAAEVNVPPGIYMGAVLMNRDTFELVDVSGRRRQDRVACQAPKGNWKLMVFYLTEGNARVVDYLDEKAMSVFISLTYEKYAHNFGSEFGKLITQTFYDEPSMHHADRMWTPAFNEFREALRLFAYEVLSGALVRYRRADRRCPQRALRISGHTLRRKLHQAAERLVRCPPPAIRRPPRPGGTDQPHAAQWRLDEGFRISDATHRR